MTETQSAPSVGAPDPELNTSPIFDGNEEDLSLDQELETAVCYFNNETFAIGSYVCSGNELLRCEGRGIWMREGACNTDEPE